MPHPCDPDLDLLTLKVVFESRVTLANSMLILVFLSLSVLNLGPMYATDRQTDRQTDRCQTDVRQHHCLMPLPRGRGYNKPLIELTSMNFWYESWVGVYGLGR